MNNANHALPILPTDNSFGTICKLAIAKLLTINLQGVLPVKPNGIIQVNAGGAMPSDHNTGKQIDHTVLLADLALLVRQLLHSSQTRVSRFLLAEILLQLDPDVNTLDTRAPINIEENYRQCLTPRQIEILTLRAKGLRAKEIGRLLSLSQATIHTHVRNACTRLGISGGWGQAVHRARNLGLLDEMMTE